MVVAYMQEVRTTDSLMTVTELDALGASDWQLISVIQNDRSVIYIFSK